MDKEDMSQERPSQEERTPVSGSGKDPAKDEDRHYVRAEDTIQKQYFTVEELAKKWEKWGLSENDVYHYGATGRLPLAYRLPVGAIEGGRDIPDGVGGHYRQLGSDCWTYHDERGQLQAEEEDWGPRTQPKYPGIYYVHRDDVHRIISSRQQVTPVHRLYYDNLCDEEEVTLFGTQPPLLTPADLLVMREDCMAFEETMNRQSTGKRKPHKNTELNAQKREQVLGAALAVLKAFPDRCQDATKIAETVDQKAALFWPDTHEAPLAFSVMVKVIREWLRKC